MPISYLIFFLITNIVESSIYVEDTITNRQSENNSLQSNLLTFPEEIERDELRSSLRLSELIIHTQQLQDTQVVALMEAEFSANYYSKFDNEDDNTTKSVVNIGTRILDSRSLQSSYKKLNSYGSRISSDQNFAKKKSNYNGRKNDNNMMFQNHPIRSVQNDFEDYVPSINFFTGANTDPVHVDIEMVILRITKWYLSLKKRLESGEQLTGDEIFKPPNHQLGRMQSGPWSFKDICLQYGLVKKKIYKKESNNSSKEDNESPKESINLAPEEMKNNLREEENQSSGEEEEVFETVCTLEQKRLNLYSCTLVDDYIKDLTLEQLQLLFQAWQLRSVMTRLRRLTSVIASDSFTNTLFARKNVDQFLLSIDTLQTTIFDHFKNTKSGQVFTQRELENFSNYSNNFESSSATSSSSSSNLRNLNVPSSSRPNPCVEQHEEEHEEEHEEQELILDQMRFPRYFAKDEVTFDNKQIDQLLSLTWEQLHPCLSITMKGGNVVKMRMIQMQEFLREKMKSIKEKRLQQRLITKRRAYHTTEEADTLRYRPATMKEQRQWDKEDKEISELYKKYQFKSFSDQDFAGAWKPECYLSGNDSNTHGLDIPAFHDKKLHNFGLHVKIFPEIIEAFQKLIIEDPKNGLPNHPFLRDVQNIALKWEKEQQDSIKQNLIEESRKVGIQIKNSLKDLLNDITSVLSTEETEYCLSQSIDCEGSNIVDEIINHIAPLFSLLNKFEKVQSYQIRPHRSYQIDLFQMTETANPWQRGGVKKDGQSVTPMTIVRPIHIKPKRFFQVKALANISQFDFSEADRSIEPRFDLFRLMISGGITFENEIFSEVDGEYSSDTISEILNSRLARGIEVFDLSFSYEGERLIISGLEEQMELNIENDESVSLKKVQVGVERSDGLMMEHILQVFGNPLWLLRDSIDFWHIPKFEKRMPRWTMILGSVFFLNNSFGDDPIIPIAPPSDEEDDLTSKNYVYRRLLPLQGLFKFLTLTIQNFIHGLQKFIERSCSKIFPTYHIDGVTTFLDSDEYTKNLINIANFHPSIDKKYKTQYTMIAEERLKLEKKVEELVDDWFDELQINAEELSFNINENNFEKEKQHKFFLNKERNASCSSNVVESTSVFLPPSLSQKGLQTSDPLFINSRFHLHGAIIDVESETNETTDEGRSWMNTSLRRKFFLANYFNLLQFLKPVCYSSLWISIQNGGNQKSIQKLMSTLMPNFSKNIDQQGQSSHTQTDGSLSNSSSLNIEQDSAVGLFDEFFDTINNLQNVVSIFKTYEDEISMSSSTSMRSKNPTMKNVQNDIPIWQLHVPKNSIDMPTKIIIDDVDLIL